MGVSAESKLGPRPAPPPPIGKFKCRQRTGVDLDGPCGGADGEIEDTSRRVKVEGQQAGRHVIGATAPDHSIVGWRRRRRRNKGNGGRGTAPEGVKIGLAVARKSIKTWKE